MISIVLALALATGSPYPGDMPRLSSTESARWVTACEVWEGLGRRGNLAETERLEAEKVGAMCTGYIDGFMHSVSRADSYVVEGHKICLPETVPAETLVRQAISLYRQNPDLSAVESPPTAELLEATLAVHYTCAK